MSIVKIRAALESALAAMPGIIPAATIVRSLNGLFETSSAHGLKPGLHVTISNHTGTNAANGSYVIADVPKDNTFLLDDVVSGLDVVSTGTGGSVIANLTAWENIDFPTITSRVPYQQVNLIPSQPEDVTYGQGYRREYGFMQVTLHYPLQLGTGEAFARAELIRSTFPRGASFSNGGIDVQIDKTPEIMRGFPDEGSYVLPVRIYYYANIFN